MENDRVRRVWKRGYVFRHEVKPVSMLIGGIGLETGYLSLYIYIYKTKQNAEFS